MRVNDPLDPKLTEWCEQTRCLTIKLPEPFSYEQNLGYLSRSTNECLFHVDNLAIYKLLPIVDKHVLIAVHSDDNKHLQVRFIAIYANGLTTGLSFLESTVGNSILPDASMLEAVSRYVWEWFDLDSELAPFYELAARDPYLNQVAEDFYGLRLLGIPDLFEALSWGIIGQQINLTFAYTLKRRLVEAFGTCVNWNGRTYWAFPTSERIAALSPDALTALQFTGKKAEYLIGVASRMKDGTLSKDKLLLLQDFTAIEKELLNIRGVGPWTANYVLMRCLRNPAALPLADVGLHNALKHVMGMEEKPSLPAIRQYAEGWRGWEAYATFYLWRVLY
ncbi:DNA-3-methyladenine glycosylase 2 family protein [Paenibacillus sp. SYP-B3998]|uniref:DNA-3-methyladenine glycosylase II n=1 Tax=Paenibacillus sp. SYP-B3998 TaxID=2678564 RepID=A0A6G4A4J7_9BACL|nr:DNA-3-methyladenine glycosylase [Paenibacillus sp. SYP-B3998]NEW09302.1 DNA-3-methyladenine glycosylase 2 family protein [Paenibacillus sp. SYP-B3998]